MHAAFAFKENDILVLDFLKLTCEYCLDLLHIGLDIVVQILHKLGLLVDQENVRVLFIESKSFSKNGLKVFTLILIL